MKRSIYNFLVHASELVLWPTRFFSPKMKLFLDGRKGVFEFLEQNIRKEDKTIWFHCASLGEYEQGLPIMESLKKKYPNYKLVLSFFSPSGYEVRKNGSIADLVCYLPLDTQANAKKFLDCVHPEMAFFVKYEFWPNYLYELKLRSIPTYLISGVFRKDQSFFRSRGSILRDSLKSFNHFFLQNTQSLELLKSIGLNNASVSGDTRFDRVSKQLEIDNHLAFMEYFKGNNLCLVCGSTWPEDEAVLLPFLNSNTGQAIKIVIAPHKIDSAQIRELQKKLKASVALYSDKEQDLLSQKKVLILDTVGLLSKVYWYADIAYVGGAMGKSGLHNILEPATFGVPIVIGKNYQAFPEAVTLEKLHGVHTIENADECQLILNRLVDEEAFRNETGSICERYVQENKGATQKILRHLEHHQAI